MEEYQKLINNFEKNKADYSIKEIWSGTVNFVKKVFTDFLDLKEETSYKSYKKNTFTQESTKQTGSNSRSDFIINFNWIKIVVEVEKTWSIEPWIKQIKEYMELENTLYWILTDWEDWYFYNNWFEKKYSKFWTWTFKKYSDLISDSWKTFFSQIFETKKYYINFLNRIDSESFLFTEENLQKDLKSFHKELIEVAEKLKVDFEKSWIFNWDDDKEVIQTVYSFIIQFLLIKIIQDKKKNLELINKKEFVKLLEEENYNGLANSIFKQIDWLWDFYNSYKNEQKHLIDKILKHYNNWPFGSNIDFDAIQWFLDLYIFIFKFNFLNVKQDIFWAVYENYLKELYKDDNSKKWQVFTPPEIVEFMLDEIWYTHTYIEKIISDYIEKNSLEYLQEKLLQNETKPDFNIPWLSIIDPACWSWTFLYKASSRIVVAIFNINKKYNLNFTNPKYAGILSENLILNNVFGFDIEAFPLYLAEMNILQTLLWFNIDDKTWDVLNKIDKQVRIFSTKDTIWEFANMQGNINEILENLEKPPIFSVSEKINPKAISELKLDIINWDLEKKLDKYIVEYIWKQLFHLDKTLEKKLDKLENISELKKYINSSENNLLKTLFNKIFKESRKYISELKNLAEKYKTSRTKFDFVIWNPPYIAYNSIPKPVRQNWKEIWMEMSNVFWINLHSIPNHPKKYSPKPNLYSYFWALAYFLAKQNWKVSYIVPEGFLAYDCNTYYLSENVNLQNLHFFNTKVFVDRWINWKMEVATSAIIFKYEKNLEKDNVKLLSYKKQKDETISSILNFMKEEKNTVSLEKSLIKKYISTWFSILKQDKQVLQFLDFYKENSQDLEIYHNHEQAQKIFNSNFYFDIWYWINEKERNLDIRWKEKDYYKYFVWKWVYYSDYNYEWWKKDRNTINLLQANQWYNLLDSKYKIIWNKTIWFWNVKSFYFEDREIIWARNNFNWIWSNDFEEILYLFWLFNAKITWKIFDFYNKKPWETREYWIFLYTIKEQIRVPKIDSEIKEELKEILIENWNRIIESVKKWNLKDLEYKDILEVGIDWIDEKIIWVKEEFEYLEKNEKLEIDLEKINKQNLLDEKLSAEILKEIEKNNNLEELERERDLLVYCLYFWGKWKEFIDLDKINLKNILESENFILKNKWVGNLKK